MLSTTWSLRYLCLWWVDFFTLNYIFIKGLRHKNKIMLDLWKESICNINQTYNSQNFQLVQLIQNEDCLALVTEIALGKMPSIHGFLSGQLSRSQASRSEPLYIKCERYCTTNTAITLGIQFLLPSASEGWGKVIVSVCPHFRGRGYPVTGLDGGTPSQVQMRGTPSQVQMGGTPSQVYTGGTLFCWWGTPSKIKTGGTPHIPPVQDWMGYPHPRDDGVPPIQDWMGYPHPSLDEVSPPIQEGMGYLPPPSPINKASTCYAAGGVPLAFTQEDFLVENNEFT